MNEQKEQETNNKEVKKENNNEIKINNEPVVKEVNIIGKENQENKNSENKEKPKLNNLLQKDEKLKEIFKLINSPINSIKRNKKLETSKEKIQNFLNDSFSDSKVRNSNSNNKNINKYQEVYEQINLLDSMNEIKKNKPLISYSQYKSYSLKKTPQTIKIPQIKTKKLFKKNEDLFSDLEKPKKNEWMTNNLFKSTNLFNYKKQKDFFGFENDNIEKINFDKTEKKLDQYYKKELNYFALMLKKGNFSNSISSTPKNRKLNEKDFTKKNSALEKLNKW